LLEKVLAELRFCHQPAVNTRKMLVAEALNGMDW
jgi:hypothetical protein